MPITYHYTAVQVFPESCEGQIIYPWRYLFRYRLGSIGLSANHAAGNPREKKDVTFNHLNVIPTLFPAMLIKKLVRICFFITLRHVG